MPRRRGKDETSYAVVKLLHGWLAERLRGSSRNRPRLAQQPDRAIPCKMTSANSRVPGSAPVFFRLKQSAARLMCIGLRGRASLVTIC